MGKQNTKITLVRHGSTNMNSSNVIRGWHDAPLSNKGLKQVEILGKELKNKNIDGIVTSDLTRARQTAEAIARHTGKPILEISAKYRPWNLGGYTGKDVKTTAPIIQDYALNQPNRRVMGGGESFSTFRNRFLSAIGDIKDKYKGKNIAVVAHHRNDRLMAAWEKKGYPKDLSVDIKTFTQKGIEPASARKIVLERRYSKVNKLADKLALEHNKIHHPMTYLQSLQK